MYTLLQSFLFWMSIGCFSIGYAGTSDNSANKWSPDKIQSYNTGNDVVIIDNNISNEQRNAHYLHRSNYTD